MKKSQTTFPMKRYAIVDKRGVLVVLFERASTTKHWAEWVATGKPGRRAVQVEIREVGRQAK